MAFAHTPNDERSEPAIGKKNAHEEHGFGADCAIGDCGQRSLSYQRLLA